MRKMLEALWDGDLIIDVDIEKRSPEHQKVCDTAYALLETLEKKLNPEEKEMLNMATGALNDANNYYSTECFVRGYCLGALMMLEVMEKRDELIL